MGDVLLTRGEEGDAKNNPVPFHRSVEIAKKLLMANPGSA